jgi:alpha-1,2-mannosyltransferase
MNWFRRDFHAFYAVLLLFMAVVLVADLINGRFNQTDFGAYLQAAARFTRAENLYQQAPGEISKMPFKYAPGIAVLFVPFLALGVMGAKLAYYVLNCAVVLAFFGVSRALVGEASGGRIVPTQGQTLIALAALGEFTYREISIGNTNAVVSLLTVAACLWALRKRELPAGMALAVATLFKPHYGIFLLYFLARRLWRSAATFGMVWIAALLVPAAVYGWSGNLTLHGAWLEVMRVHNAAGQWIHPMYGMNTVFEVLSRPFELLHLESFVSSPVFPLLVLLLLTAGLVIAARRAHSGLPAFPLIYLVACTPLLWQVDVNHFIFLLPVILLLLGLWRTQAVWWRIAVAAGLVLLGGNIYELWGRANHAMFYDAGVYGIGALLLLLALIFADLPQPDVS